MSGNTWISDLSQQVIGMGDLIAPHLDIDATAALAKRNFTLPGCVKVKARISKPDIGCGGCDCGCGQTWKDWISFTAKLKNISMKDAAALVQEWTGTGKRPGKAARTPASQVFKPLQEDAGSLFNFLTWNDALAGLWCLKKKPIQPAVMQEIGCKFATHYSNNVFAFPVFGPDGSNSPPINFVRYRSNGQPFKWKKKDGSWDEAKSLTNKDGSVGIMGRPEDVDRLLAGDNDESLTIWKTEGPTDLMSFLSAGFPENHIAVTTPFGCRDAKGAPDWLIKCFSGANVNIIHDADTPGQKGAAERLAKQSVELRLSQRREVLR